MPIDSLQTQSLRNDQARMQLEHQNDKTLKELTEKNKLELERVVQHHEAVKADLEKAYDIDLSTSTDQHEKRLAEIHMSQAKQLEDEKARGEAEVDKARARYHEQIAKYRENSEKALSDMLKRNDESASNIKRVREREKGKA